MTTWFMIRDKVTGKHLPTRTGRMMSYTSLKLTDERPPRLFSKKGHATQAMTCWKKGILFPKFLEPTEDQKQSMNLVGLALASVNYEFRTNSYVAHPVKDRENANLEVVEVTIVIN